jgi:hypothetical protein
MIRCNGAFVCKLNAERRGKKKRQNKLKGLFIDIPANKSTANQKEESHIHSFFLHLGRKRAVK